MTVWHWVRHGPTHAKSFVGWRDVAADLSNQEQIDRLRASLPDQALVISSDLQRARHTADALQRSSHRRLPHDAHLREIHFGIWDGMIFDKVADRDPDLSRRFWEEPGDVFAPQGESWNVAAARVNTVVERLNHHYPKAHIIAVAHFGVILTQVQRALSVSAYDVLAHKIDNLSVTRIEWENGAGSIGHINHLP